MAPFMLDLEKPAYANENGLGTGKVDVHFAPLDSCPFEPKEFTNLENPVEANKMCSDAGVARYLILFDFEAAGSELTNPEDSTCPDEDSYADNGGAQPDGNKQKLIRRSDEGKKHIGKNLNGLGTIKQNFHMPIKQVAKELNVGIATLTCNCRNVGIHRWPYRKTKSIQTLIDYLQVKNGGAQPEKNKREILKELKEEKRKMKENPNIQLALTTKQFRQCHFKAMYEKRKNTRLV
ncbi:Plant regulator RWP-RK [Artemisia annua]|uniref:Plant regulator RWP-RK n=1 Tax=Artemisia annua TaxID=35608 RepID=A0A2U1KDP5_ARTAN|nr:Plant regulator RWP-RK [Artemisia annua]